jgi:PAS domain S-box-containing protein
MTELIRSQIDFIYFVYGLGFFLLLPICLYLHRRPGSPLPWIWLLLFGAAHGLLEWLDLAAMSLGSDPVFDVVRLGLMILSFLLLAEFGRAGLVRLRGRGPGRWVLAVLLGLALLGAFAGLPGVRASARYVLGLVGALGAAAALWLAAHRAAPGRGSLQGAALCLSGYAAATGLVVDPAPFFPASWLNTEVFLAATGVPIQLGRGFLAAGLSACLSVFAVASLGQENHRRLQRWGRNLMLGTVVSVLALVISAWFVTQYLGRDAAREVRSDQDHQVQVLQFGLRDKMAEGDHLVTTLAGSPGIVSYLSSRTPPNRDQAHAVLDRYSASLPGTIISVVGREGLTIASSNRLTPDSFLGKSYAVCHYFQQALQGAKGSCWDFEVTSGEPAYCASFPVRDDRGEIIGVAVIQRIISDLGGLFPPETFVVIIEAHGVVVQSNRPDMVSKSLWPLPAAVQEQLIASRQFGPGPFVPILAEAPVDGGYCRFQSRRYLVLRQPLPFQDWSIVILTSPRPIAVARMLGLSIAILACLAVLSLLTIIGLTIESTSRVQRSENRFRQLYGNLRDGSAVVDMSGNIVEWNPAFQAMLGYPPEELIKLSLRDLTPETWQEQEARIIAEQVLPRGFSRLYEQEYRRRDGSVLPVELQTYLIQEDGEQAGRMWVFARDITGRRQIEDNLLEEKVFSETTIDSLPGVFYLFDEQGKFRRWNKNFERATGYSAKEIAGMHPLDIFSREDQKNIEEKIREVFVTGEAAVEANLVSKDGRQTPYIFTGLRVTLDKTPYLIGTGQDITQRKQAEEAFRSLVSHAPMGIFIIQDGKFILINPGFETVTGYRKEDLLGHESKCLATPQYKDMVKREATKRLKGESSTPFEFQFITKSGETRWGIETIAPTQFAGKMATLGYFMDVTEHKQLEAKFLQAQKMEAVGTLAGGIAHDFNNILTAILGNIGLAGLDDKIGPRVHDRLAQAEAACLRAQALSQQLLTFAKGGVPIKKIFSSAELLTQSTAFTCAGSPVRCETTFPENLWWIEADPGQIGQVFQNLTINAIQAMPTGGTIKVWAENLTLGTESDLPLSAGKYIKISMRDQGMGIQAEHLPKIFDPYFTTKQKGSGLGLASAYAIIKKHHGHIGVESTPGVGTTFHTYLPAVDQQPTPQPAEKRELLVGTGKILVMDDEEMVREVLGRMLASLSYEAQFARDGAEAIEMFSQAQGSGQVFAVVILDLTVPGGMGGKDAMAKLLEIDPQVKAVVSSGYSDDPVMADFQKYGFRGVIAKPYRISELGKILNKVIMKKA